MTIGVSLPCLTGGMTTSLMFGQNRDGMYTEELCCPVEFHLPYELIRSVPLEVLDRLCRDVASQAAVLLDQAIIDIAKKENPNVG